MDDTDDALTRQLREVFDAVDAPPAHVVEAAKASRAWHDVDAELAQLAADSSDDPALALRATEPPRLLTFVSGDTTVVVEVSRDGSVRHLFGQLIAPGAADVDVRHAGGVVTVAADADGRFRATEVDAGPFSVRCRFAEPDRASVVTSWILI